MVAHFEISGDQRDKRKPEWQKAAAAYVTETYLDRHRQRLCESLLLRSLLGNDYYSNMRSWYEARSRVRNPIVLKKEEREKKEEEEKKRRKACSSHHLNERLRHGIPSVRRSGSIPRNKGKSGKSMWLNQGRGSLNPSSHETGTGVRFIQEPDGL